MSDEQRTEWRASTEGVLDGSIEWGGEEGMDPRLMFGVAVPLAPLQLHEHATDEAPLLRLHSIRLAVRSWRELEGRTFAFPRVVKQLVGDGESHPIYDNYGSLRLGAEYHQVLMTAIAFGLYTGGRIAASLRGSVRSVSQPPLFAPVSFSCEATLAVGPLFVRGDVGTHTLPTLAEAEKLAQSLLRLEDYEAPQNQSGRVLLKPSC